MNSTKNRLINEIQDRINDRFVKIGENYTPKDPGRQEFRKCGVKRNELTLTIEEVLYDVAVTNEEIHAAEIYATQAGYQHFLTYHAIRRSGWILIKEDIKTEVNNDISRSNLNIYTKYFYKLYQPDKNFNRKISTHISHLLIVTPFHTFSSEIFSALETESLVFAVSHQNTFTIISATQFPTAESLLSNYIPNKRVH
ncbi:hypothetical protein NEAUS05_2247 [Nematocida ausubeli]|nr:hypothetical protein NEAUS07_2045 [Nematocida ausubeli]KAI5138031.1 hypothetical protein NEAUS07_2222 [Nematocida ausubeli]KAI5150190.1 hypothetical protein NEAUS05_2074 [Nematocida ausubeli]KAI5150643.1 hypothetical protein NEAUS05_2247 [Nematocida ausubeli]